MMRAPLARDRSRKENGISVASERLHESVSVGLFQVLGYLERLDQIKSTA
jgi:hypothetical protein